LLDEAPQTYSGLFTQYGYFYQSLLLVVLFWLVLFAIAGTYNIHLYKKSRLKELTGYLPAMPYRFFIAVVYSFLNDREQHILISTLFFSYSYYCKPYWLQQEDYCLFPWQKT
jgi:hypothetical protein